MALRRLLGYLLPCLALASHGTRDSARQALIRHEIAPGGSLVEVQEPRETAFKAYCSECCNDGHSYVPCLDVEACASAAQTAGRYALIFSYVGKPGLDVWPYMESAKKAASLANQADLILLMTASDATNLSPAVRRALEKQGVKIRPVAWSLPPGMRFTKAENWCGQKDFIRLHALGLDEYDAVAYFDNDIEFQGDVTPLLRCASTGRFLSTNGGIGEALNVGFFALRPHRALLEAAVRFAKEADYSQLTGWGNEGWRPSGGYYVGGECGQGFFHALFYKRHASLSAQLASVGSNWSASQVDKCVWNYQTSFQCQRGFDCGRVRVHHKPAQPGSDPEECLKSHLRRPQRTADSRSSVELREIRGRNATAQVGFYFPVHNQVEGAVEVLRSARQFYPDSPIHVLQDGGNLDFGPLCRSDRFHCSYERAAGENSRWNPHSWFARMRNAAAILKTQYVIYLEPDVKITRHHRGDFPSDAGGVYDNFNPSMSSETKAYLEYLGRGRNPGFNVSWMHFGLCGGSYYRTEAIMDAFHPQHVSKIDWRGLRLKEGIDKTMSSDFAMAVALAARGWTVTPWAESAQLFADAPTDPDKLRAFQEKWPACHLDAAFQHNHKELYHAEISELDRLLVARYPNNPPDVTCHGCVWYQDARPESKFQVPSEPPIVEGPTSYGYAGQHPSPPVSLLSHPDYILNAGSGGLPKAEGPRPAWLVKQDLLVVDARPKGAGGIVILQPVFMEAGPLWGQEAAPTRPRWLRSILATNRRHAREHALAMVIRWLPSKPQLLEWQRAQCGQISEEECTKRNERENFNWEKHRMLQEYLLSPQNFSHVMLLDADAALVRHDRDVLRGMVSKLESEKREVLFTNEDWLRNGAARINGGVILAKNGQWSQDLFRDTVDAHVQGPKGLKSWRIGLKDRMCSSNEQICLNDAMGSEEVRARTLLASGIAYNRGGCTVRKCGEPVSDVAMAERGMADDRLVILHFMGDHTLADKVLCDGPVDYTGEGAGGYGCSRAGSLLAVNASIPDVSPGWTFLCC